MNEEMIIEKLKTLGSEEHLEAQKRAGIYTTKAFGIRIPVLRQFAKEIKKKDKMENHRLALKLWKTEFHEARLLSAMLDHPKYVTEQQIDEWVKDFDTWDICDTVIFQLFWKTDFAREKINQWYDHPDEFVKRAAFAMIAKLAISDKKAPNSDYVKFFPMIKKAATDERNFVKKAVNWALRQIGKRNFELNKQAFKIAEKIAQIDSKSAKWIAKDAIRELRSKTTQRILARREKSSKK